MRCCPVCQMENNQLSCTNCGFDGSCDYERNPSLGQLPARVDSVAQRRAEFQARKQNAIRCPKCGGTSFSMEQSLQCTCTSCKYRFSLAPAPARESLKVTQVNPEKPTVLPKKSALQYNRLETFVLRLGWVYIPIQTVYLLFGTDGFLFQDDVVFTVIRYGLVILTILMHLRIWKKGLREAFRSKLLNALDGFWAGFGRMMACCLFIIPCGSLV